MELAADQARTNLSSTALDGLPGREAWLRPESFWLPSRFMPASAWNEHIPFAFWLVAALRPRTVVELGTHYGASYFAFCDVVKRLGLPTRTWAVDSWEGDEHAGFYGDEVYRTVEAINEEEYAEFSTLVRGYFDQKVDDFADGSIDLLHVDGRHRYEDVKHDFESYVPKLSERAVVIFHDIAERKDDFGVWRFWEELAAEHPSRAFAFEHGHGLGVLGAGDRLPEPAAAFFATAAERPDEVRAEYARLGARLGELADRRFGFEALGAELGQTRAEADAAQAALEQTRQQLEKTSGELAQAVADAAAAHEELHRTYETLSWRVTGPLRAFRARKR